MNFDSLLNIELSKRKFWEFCNTLEPDFYKPERKHLITLCNTLEDFYFGKLLKPDGEAFTKLMMRLPPQHGKSRTLVNFTKWVLGLNTKERIITASRSDSQATDFSRYTRDGIQEIKNLPDQIVYSDIFPNTKIKRGDSAVQKWALEGEHFNYLGVGVSGGVTGKGATLRIMDDIIKDAEQALNETALEKIWIWLSGTFSSRNSAEGGEVKEIFCATLWGERDPQSILEQTEGDEWYILSMPVFDADKDEMLCDDLLSKKAFVKLKARMCVDSRTKMIFYANYMCKAIDDNESKAFPRSSIKTYKDIPTETINESGETKEQGWTFAIIDPADEGTDYFSMPIFQVLTDEVYLKDAIFDQENLTIQESQVVAKVKEHKIGVLFIETNNAGAYFVRRMRELLPHVEIMGFWSKSNKMARILSYAGIIKLFFRFPESPNPTTERLMNQLFRLMKTSKKEDDAADSVAGAARYLESHYSMFK
jgi:predicted phage terminase large subunit-like protein